MKFILLLFGFIALRIIDPVMAAEYAVPFMVLAFIVVVLEGIRWVGEGLGGK
jgi:hypothetical protein